MYKPDFSAHIGSELLRCIRISKASFDTILSLSKQEDPNLVEDLQYSEGGTGSNSDNFVGRRRAGSERSGGIVTPIGGSTTSRGKGGAMVSGRFSPGGKIHRSFSGENSTSAKLRRSVSVVKATLDPGEIASAGVAEKKAEDCEGDRGAVVVAAVGEVGGKGDAQGMLPAEQINSAVIVPDPDCAVDATEDTHRRHIV